MTILIIGAGFSGTLTAIHLLRRGFSRPTRIILVSRVEPMARGVAYGTRNDQHLLNVVAGRMSALTDDEDSFLRFAQSHNPSIDGASFVSRRIYGDYLGHLLDRAEAEAAPGMRLERVLSEVESIEVSESNQIATVLLSNGEQITADRVVLATGNFAPSNPPIQNPEFYASPRYVRDPWAPGALDTVDPDAGVLLIGTGLTMLDVVLDLHHRAKLGRAKLVALSRRGLLPQPHRSPGVPPSHDHLPPGLLTGPNTVRNYFHAVRSHIKELAEQNIDWREVINSMRPITPKLWQMLPVKERSRFLRHVRHYWDVCRHRMATEPADILHRLMEDGELSVVAGRLVSLTEQADSVEVTLRLRQQHDLQRLKVSSVVNCTGPETNIARLADPLMQSLCVQGLIQPDALGLGLELSDKGAAINQNGQASQVLYYVGPLLKARYWESIAVPELRIHTATLAETIRNSFEAAPAGVTALSE
ncbi:MAG TPA: FAD/NAD(P)-binding protein [Acidobacteriota bacterium]|nr:FAD/NAD(P)-binding protein [Acidobacteriota bacterium]